MASAAMHFESEISISESSDSDHDDNNNFSETDSLFKSIEEIQPNASCSSFIFVPRKESDIQRKKERMGKMITKGTKHDRYGNRFQTNCMSSENPVSPVTRRLGTPDKRQQTVETRSDILFLKRPQTKRSFSIVDRPASSNKNECACKATERVNISSISKAGSRIYGQNLLQFPSGWRELHTHQYLTDTNGLYYTCFKCAVQETEVAKRCFHFQLEANTNGSFTCKRCNYELTFEEVYTVSSERNNQILEENTPKSSKKCTENTNELKRSNTKYLCEKASKQPQVMLERCDNLLIERNLLQSNHTSNEIVILPTFHMDNCVTQSLFGSPSTEHNETQSENNPETPSTSGVSSPMSSNQQKTSFLNGKGNARVTRCKLKLRSLKAIKKQKIQNIDSDSKTRLCPTCGRQVCETRWVFHQNKFHPTDDTKKYTKIPSNEKHKTMYLCNHCKYRTFHNPRIRKHVTLHTTESNEAKECEDCKTVYPLDKFNLHRCKMAIAIQKLGLLGLLKD